MILIADSGSTKTEWTAMDDLTGEVTGHAYTKGLNPYFVTEEEIREEIRTKLLPMSQLPSARPVPRSLFPTCRLVPKKQISSTPRPPSTLVARS